MLAMPEKYNCVAPDLRGFGLTENKVIDATQGAMDWALDLVDLLERIKHFYSTHCGLVPRWSCFVTASVYSI